MEERILSDLSTEERHDYFFGDFLGFFFVAGLGGLSEVILAVASESAIVLNRSAVFVELTSGILRVTQAAIGDRTGDTSSLNRWMIGLGIFVQIRTVIKDSAASGVGKLNHRTAPCIRPGSLP